MTLDPFRNDHDRDNVLQLQVTPVHSCAILPALLLIIMDDLEPLDPAYVADVLSRPPFVTISGVINVRDLGLYPSTSEPDKITKPRFLYRGAELSRITEEGVCINTIPGCLDFNDSFSGKAQLTALGISTVFDLRSDAEIEKYNAPLPEIDGVEILHTPVFQTEDYSPEMMAKYVRVTINTLHFP